MSMYDLSQIPKPNYDEIFDDIIKKQPELKQLIEYIRQIPNSVRNTSSTQKEINQLLLETKPNGEKIVQTIFSQLTNRYMRVSINVAYKFSVKHNAPLDETIQYALEELFKLCVDYIEKNIEHISVGVYSNYTYTDTYGNLYTYIYQGILRRLESEKSNLLNIPSPELINSILKNREKKLQEQSDLIEKNDISNKYAYKKKLLLLQDQLKTLKDLALNLEIEYRNAFEKELLEQKRLHYISYDLAELKECTKLILGKYRQILAQFNMTEIGIVRKINNSEHIYTSCDVNDVVDNLINSLNGRIYKLIDTTNERIYNTDLKVQEQIKQTQKNITALKGEIKLYSEISLPPYSVEKIMENEQEWELGLYDESLESAITHKLLKEELIDVLYTLTPREEKVLRLRFGLNDGRTRTLEEVGEEFEVPRERIRQIEAKALRKLRHPSRSKKLKDFLD